MVYFGMLRTRVNPRLGYLSQGGCSCFCDCVVFPGLGGASHERPADAPETFTDTSAQRGMAFTGKSGFRPRHRRGHSTGERKMEFKFYIEIKV